MNKQKATGRRTGPSGASSSASTGSGVMRHARPSRKAAGPSELDAGADANPGVSRPVRKPEPRSRSAQASGRQELRPASTRSIRGPVPSQWAAQMSGQPKPRPTSSQTTRQPEPSARSSKALEPKSMSSKATRRPLSTTSAQQPAQPQDKAGQNLPTRVKEAVEKKTVPGPKPTKASSTVRNQSARKDQARPQLEHPVVKEGARRKAKENSARSSASVKESIERQFTPDVKAKPSASATVRQTVEKQVEPTSNSKTVVPPSPKRTAGRKRPWAGPTTAREAGEKRSRINPTPRPSPTTRGTVESKAQAKPSSKPTVPEKVADSEETTASAGSLADPAASVQEPALRRVRPMSQLRAPTPARETEEFRVSPNSRPGSGTAQSELHTKPTPESVVPGAARKAGEDGAQTALSPVTSPTTTQDVDMGTEAEPSSGPPATAVEEGVESKPSPRATVPVQEAGVGDNPERQPESPTAVHKTEGRKLLPLAKVMADVALPEKPRPKPKLTLLIPETGYRAREIRSEPVVNQNPLAAIREAVSAEVQSNGVRPRSPAEREAAGGSPRVDPHPGPTAPFQVAAQTRVDSTPGIPPAIAPRYVARVAQIEPTPAPPAIPRESGGKGAKSQLQSPDRPPTTANQASGAKPQTRPEPRLPGPVQAAADRKAARLYRTRRGRKCAQTLEVTMDLLRDLRQDDADPQSGQRDPAEVKVHWNDVRAQLQVEDGEIYGNWEAWEVRDTRPVWLR